MTARRPPPLLVTGLPRSGTTWLARECARAPRTALAGREPMNPRQGQFALGGTLDAWARLDGGATQHQRRTLRRVYRGLEPRVYSRYGVRQWAAALMTSRLVVKDPFALLSLTLITTVTGAVPVVVFRHPGALLASYQRMGWHPAVHEIVDLHLASVDNLEVPVLPPHADLVDTMAWFWSVCYSAALDDLDSIPGAVVVDHAELAQGGDEALRHLLHACGVGSVPLHPGPRQTSRTRDVRRQDAAGPRLHNFDRTPDDVIAGWRRALAPEDATRIETSTVVVRERLRERRLMLGPGPRPSPTVGMEKS